MNKLKTFIITYDSMIDELKKDLEINISSVNKIMEAEGKSLRLN